MELNVQMLSIIGAAVAVSFGAIGPALGEGRAIAAAMDAIARQPEAAGTLSRTLFVGLAMIGLDLADAAVDLLRSGCEPGHLGLAAKNRYQSFSAIHAEILA